MSLAQAQQDKRDYESAARKASPFSGWMTVGEFAKAAGVPENTVYQSAQRKAIKCERVSGRLLINPIELRRIPQPVRKGKKKTITISVTLATLRKLKENALGGNQSFTLDVAVWFMFALLGKIMAERDWIKQTLLHDMIFRSGADPQKVKENLLMFVSWIDEANAEQS